MTLVNQKAPVFQAKAVVSGSDIVDFDLSSIIGKHYIVLFFYPKDFTFVCPTELHAFQDKLPEFQKRDTQIIACSTDSEYAHLAWLNQPKKQGGIQGITYPVVADINKTVARSYGVLDGEVPVSALKQTLTHQLQQVQAVKNLLQSKAASLPGLESLTSAASLMESSEAAIPALTPTDQVAFRALFIIDKKGIIQHASVNNMALGRNVDEVLRLIDALQHVKRYGEVCPANWHSGAPAMKPTAESTAAYLAK
ncbi:MAG: peroxiredoxin [Verrucomicrobiota bacterium]|nr:MAG: peroxiredoxin [Verrucomicrobiota bacterium]